MPAPLQTARPVTVSPATVGVTVTITGELGQHAGEALVQATARAVADGAPRVEIDLCGITGFTDDGASALVACRALCAGAADGLHYRTGQGPGRDALLVAYAEE